ncbi:MAG: metalloregulator ArsR/SmtB family transcription factor [Patescibacteria group bacterium]|nr:metalloregulator ArsR/SmtB family transcription factor [Patescibacteria group bacterium]
MNHMTERSKHEEGERIFKVLASAKRLAILHALDGKEMSVDELTKKLGVRKSNISQHLAILRYARLVKMRKDGTKVYYKVTDPKVLAGCRIIGNFARKYH